MSIRTRSKGKVSSSQLDSSPIPGSKPKKTSVSTREVVSGREQKQTVSPPPKLQSDAPASAGARPVGDAKRRKKECMAPASAGGSQNEGADAQLELTKDRVNRHKEEHALSEDPLEAEVALGRKKVKEWLACC